MMKTVRQVVVGVLSVAFLVGGVTLVAPLGSEAEAGGYYKHKRVNHKDLARDHEDLEGKQNMIKDTLDAVEGNQAMTHDNQAKTHEWLEKIETAIGELEPGAAGPPCGVGTKGVRFNPSTDDTEVCDNNTGLYWVKGPDTTLRNHEEAITYCDTLNLGNFQKYRLPMLGELIGVVDSTQLIPPFPLPGAYPVIPTVFSQVVAPFPYWSASGSTSGSAWSMDFRNGLVASQPKFNFFFVWCVRSGL